MNTNLELAARILCNRFNNPRTLDYKSLAPTTTYDQDHEALATSIALIIEHLQREDADVELHLDNDH